MVRFPCFNFRHEPNILQNVQKKLLFSFFWKKLGLKFWDIENEIFSELLCFNKSIELTILHLYKIIIFQQLSTFFQTLSELGNGWEWGHKSNPSHYIFVFLNIIEIHSSFKTITDVWNEYVLEGSFLLNIFRLFTNIIFWFILINIFRI